MSAKKLKLTHPGKILREEFMEPVGITAYALAKALHVPLPRVNCMLEVKVLPARATLMLSPGPLPRKTVTWLTLAKVLMVLPLTLTKMVLVVAAAPAAVRLTAMPGVLSPVMDRMPLENRVVTLGVSRLSRLSSNGRKRVFRSMERVSCACGSSKRPDGGTPGKAAANGVARTPIATPQGLALVLSAESSLRWTLFTVTAAKPVVNLSRLR